MFTKKDREHLRYQWRQEMEIEFTLNDHTHQQARKRIKEQRRKLEELWDSTSIVDQLLRM